MTAVSSGNVHAPARKGAEVLRHTGQGPQLISAKPLNRDSAYTLGFQRLRNGSLAYILSDADSKVEGEDLGYDGDGSTVTFTGGVLAGLPVPGSLELGGSSASVKDLLKDGNLYVDGPARILGSGGTFATMASESFTVVIDGGVEQVITLGTEASLALAVAAINTQLKNAVATAAGAQNVNITSDSSVPGETSVEITAADAGITTKLGLAVTAEQTTLVGQVVYGTGTVELTYPPGYIPAGGTPVASLTSSNTGPFNFEPGLTLVIDTDAGGDETCTFAAAPAQADGSGGSFAAMAAETMIVQVDGGDAQTVTFGTEATIALAVQTINEQIIGAHAEALDADNVRIESDSRGTASEIVLSSVAAGISTKIGLADGTDNGTGDVANIDAVTAAEIKTVVEADTTGLTVTVNPDQSFTLTAATSINVNASSTAETIVGLTTSIVTATTYISPITADYISTPLIPAGSCANVRIPNLSEIDELVMIACGATGGVALDVKTIPQGSSFGL